MHRERVNYEKIQYKSLNLSCNIQNKLIR